MARRNFQNRKPYRYRPPKFRRSKAAKNRVSATQILITAALVGTFGGLVYSMASKGGDSGEPMAVAALAPSPGEAASDIACSSIVVVDGDTFRCDGKRIRLQGIDAPELDGHCRPGRQCTPGDPVASSDNLKGLMASGTTRCIQTDTDRYGRIVARCTSGEADLSCEQVRSGHAVLRYAPISC